MMQQQYSFRIYTLHENGVAKISSGYTVVISLLSAMACFLFAAYFSYRDTFVPTFLLVALGIIMFGATQIFSRVKLAKNNYKSSGTLHVNTEGVNLNDQFLPFTNIENLEFTFAGRAGEAISGQYATSRYVVILEGYENAVTFLHNGKQHHYNFHIDSEPAQSSYKLMLHELYKGRIPFTEYLGHSIQSRRKSLLARINWTYAEIQEIRKQYDIQYPVI